MSALVEAYINEIAEGRIPALASEESLAYMEWSARRDVIWTIVKESALKVYGHQYYLLGSMV
jgi:hypothetical protein